MGRLIRKFLLLALAAVLFCGAILWGIDWLILRHKIAKGEAYGEIEVHHRYAVHLKNKRIEERSEPPTIEECVHSIFPSEDTPCWYLIRHTDDVKELDGGRWHFF